MVASSTMPHTTRNIASTLVTAIHRPMAVRFVRIAGFSCIGGSSPETRPQPSRL